MKIILSLEFKSINHPISHAHWVLKFDLSQHSNLKFYLLDMGFTIVYCFEFILKAHVSLVRHFCSKKLKLAYSGKELK